MRECSGDANAGTSSNVDVRAANHNVAKGEAFFLWGNTTKVSRRRSGRPFAVLRLLRPPPPPVGKVGGIE